MDALWQEWTSLGRIICWSRQTNGIQGGGSEPGTKEVDPIRRFPVWRKITNYVFCFVQVMDLFNRQIIQRKDFYGDTKLRRKGSWTDSCPHFFQILCSSYSGDCCTLEGEGGREGAGRSNRVIKEQTARGLHGAGFFVTQPCYRRIEAWTAGDCLVWFRGVGGHRVRRSGSQVLVGSCLHSITGCILAEGCIHTSSEVLLGVGRHTFVSRRVHSDSRRILKTSTCWIKRK